MSSNIPTHREPLIVSPEVIKELGGRDAALAALATIPSSYRCVVCGNYDSFDTDRPACVVVKILRDSGRHDKDIRLAHPRCSQSKIWVIRSAPTAHSYVALPGTAWLRAADADPPAVLVIARNVTHENDTPDPHSAQSFLSRLIEHGFAMLHDPEKPLARVSGLTAWHTPGRLAIYDKHGVIIWDGRLPSSHAWTYAALRSRLLGVVVANGVCLAQPGQARGLYSAITENRAAGAAINLVDPSTLRSHRRSYHIRHSVARSAGAA